MAKFVRAWESADLDALADRSQALPVHESFDPLSPDFASSVDSILH